jgi:hypothetical protein
LRSHPHLLDRLATELESGDGEPAMEFPTDAIPTTAEQARLARPARQAMERWANRIPAPNYTTRKHLKELRN